jgi:hypothetical protein
MSDERRSTPGGRVLYMGLLLMVFTPLALAVSRGEVDKLSRQCETAREQKLTPLRAEKTRDCVEQKIRAPDHCRRYFSTYGNNSMSGGLRKQGMFYDLPECRAYLEADQALQSGK